LDPASLCGRVPAVGFHPPYPPRANLLIAATFPVPYVTRFQFCSFSKPVPFWCPAANFFQSLILYFRSYMRDGRCGKLIPFDLRFRFRFSLISFSLGDLGSFLSACFWRIFSGTVGVLAGSNFVSLPYCLRFRHDGPPRARRCALRRSAR